MDDGFGSQAETPLPALTTKSLTVSFEATAFDDNSTLLGALFAAPDSSAAAGPLHVVSAVNSILEIFDKDGVNISKTPLATFFSALTPSHDPFNPKVIYDQFDDRFVVVALDQTDVADGDAENSSTILVAISETSDPTGAWILAAIDSEMMFGIIPSWANFPGLGLDGSALYLSTEQFSFEGTGGDFLGTRQWAIEKDPVDGLYAGNAATVAVFDLFSDTENGHIDHTIQPAHLFGSSPFASGAGNLFSSYSGLSDGTDEFLLVLSLDDPFGTPVTTAQFIALGNIEDPTLTLPDAPQLGTGALIETQDRRTLNAVWRADSLYVATTILPELGHPDAGEATALWLELDTSTLAAITLSDSGTVGGEDIASGTHTFYPAIGVNDDGDMIVGFSASASTIYAGSYFSLRQTGDAPGTIGATRTLRSGIDHYFRTLGADSLWGRYSSVSVDPATQCLWIFNQHADLRGFGTPPEDGRWATAAGLFCACQGDDTSGDSDFDDLCNDSDNCPFDVNPGQEDADADGSGDPCDICPGFLDSADADADNTPDGCDVCAGFDDSADEDEDTVPDGCDICAGSDDLTDSDNDSVPDGCDLCEGFNDSEDADADGTPDGCDACAGFDDSADEDADTVPDGCDICAGSDDLTDSDADSVPDGCDLCEGFDDGEDSDDDDVPDGCDVLPGEDDKGDDDDDGVINALDACPGFDDNLDADADSVPDDCDICAGFDDHLDADTDGVPDGCDLCAGSDDSADQDADNVPDGCDICAGFDDGVDTDDDHVPDGCDQCADFDDSQDADADGVPDGCDVLPGEDDNGDDDADGVSNALDACPGFNDSLDADTDGVPDGCDVCAGSDDQVDTDADQVPDGCDLCAGFDDGQDADADGVPDGCDVLPGEDDNGDNDDDGVDNAIDVCPGFNDTVDTDADNVPDGCDVCAGFDDLLDADVDKVPDGCDVCAGFDDGVDSDADGVPDGCDALPGVDDNGDDDSDGVINALDICPGFDDHVDVDADEIPDGCDLCQGNNAYGDLDQDGICDLDIFEDDFESSNTDAWSVTKDDP